MKFLYHSQIKTPVNEERIWTFSLFLPRTSSDLERWKDLPALGVSKRQSSDARNSFRNFTLNLRLLRSTRRLKVYDRLSEVNTLIEKRTRHIHKYKSDQQIFWSNMNFADKPNNQPTAKKIHGFGRFHWVRPLSYSPSSAIIFALVFASRKSSFISLISSTSIWDRPAKDARIDAGASSCRA